MEGDEMTGKTVYPQCRVKQATYDLEHERAEELQARIERLVEALDKAEKYTLFLNSCMDEKDVWINALTHKVEALEAILAEDAPKVVDDKWDETLREYYKPEPEDTETDDKAALFSRLVDWYNANPGEAENILSETETEEAFDVPPLAKRQGWRVNDEGNWVRS
jgi:hypothetical protein